jgi:hypothetical protein
MLRFIAACHHLLWLFPTDAESAALTSSRHLSCQIYLPVVAFFKLAGKTLSKLLKLPARHLINCSLLSVNLAAMGGFLAAGYLGLKTLLSFIKGYMLTAAVGGDMRRFS